MTKKKILLVEPDFPISKKSKNHKDFLPIGLLKIASYLKSNGNEVKLLRGKLKLEDFDFKPDEIWVTSLFTYWSQYVIDSVKYYRDIFPRAKIKVGGVYASLMPKHCKKHTGCDEVVRGVLEEAEKFLPDYRLLNNENSNPIDYQVLHASRGCSRHCRFCGTWIIEPEFKPVESIKDKIFCRKLVFYDNNFFANPHVESILGELIELKKLKKILWCEAQSGFDGRILIEKPSLARMIKKAGFRYPRLAWDWEYDKFKEIKQQIDILVDGGYKPKDVYVFVLYNWEIPFQEMEKKRIKCWKWQVQISDCRYRPLDQPHDRYNPKRTDQTNQDYHIHEESGWTDSLVKQFRSNVRRQNICVRHNFEFYSKEFEQKKVDKETLKEIMTVIKTLRTKKEKVSYLKKKGISHWFPDKITYPERRS